MLQMFQMRQMISKISNKKIFNDADYFRIMNDFGNVALAGNPANFKSLFEVTNDFYNKKTRGKYFYPTDRDFDAGLVLIVWLINAVILEGNLKTLNYLLDRDHIARIAGVFAGQLYYLKPALVVELAVNNKMIENEVIKKIAERERFEIAARLLARTKNGEAQFSAVRVEFEKLSPALQQRVIEAIAPNSVPYQEILNGFLSFVPSMIVTDFLYPDLEFHKHIPPSLTPTFSALSLSSPSLLDSSEQRSDEDDDHDKRLKICCFLS